jgi:hypothetical protein
MQSFEQSDSLYAVRPANPANSNAGRLLYDSKDVTSHAI